MNKKRHLMLNIDVQMDNSIESFSLLMRRNGKLIEVNPSEGIDIVSICEGIRNGIQVTVEVCEDGEESCAYVPIMRIPIKGLNDRDFDPRLKEK